MNTIKCPQCNLTNWITQANCKRCGLELAYNQSAIPPASVVGDGFARQHASYDSGQSEFQSPNNPFANQSNYNQANSYSATNNQWQNNRQNSSPPNYGQQNYRQNYQQPNYQQSNYQPNYNSNPRYQKSAGKIKLAVVSLVFGILGFPPIIFVAMGFFAGFLGAIFGVGGGVVGLLIPAVWIPIAFICGIIALRRTNKSPQEYGGKGMAIAGIVLSSLTILLVPLVGAIAVPNLLAARRAANEGSAISTIRTLKGAEETYMATTGKGKCGDIQSLVVNNLIESTLSNGEKSGYRFTANPSSSGGCEITATPTVTQGVTSTGTRSFYSTSEDGWKIHAAEKGSPAGKNDKEIN